MSMSPSLNVRIDPAQREQLARLSAETDWPLADLVRTGVALLLERRAEVQPRRLLREAHR
jgi:Ribbon-helix-helix domain